ncbi:MAG TPA: hypothetical protein VJ552_05430 [Sediminibacterium sp.]|nr:hypothetical protein [Sediminibacterium sp.]
MKLTEGLIQYNLMRWLRSNNQDVFVPNYFIGSFECDLLRLTSSDLLVEYEIKTSRSDFKNDFKKARRSWRDGVVIETKHDFISIGKRVNRFYYVVPEGLITPDEVPAGFGLIYAENPREMDPKYGYKFNVLIKFRIVKMSKLFTREKLAEKKYRHIAQNLCMKLENQKRITYGAKNDIRFLRNQLQK